MGINIDNKISDEDRQAVKNGNSGVAGGFSEQDLDDFFDGSDDIFKDFDIGADSAVGSTGSDGGSNEVKWGGDAAQYNQNQQTNTGNKTKTDEAIDKLFDEAVDLSKDSVSVLKQMVKGIKYRTLDDYGYLATVHIETGAKIAIAGVAVAVISAAIGLGNPVIMLGVNTTVCGVTLLAVGMSALFISANLIQNGVSIGCEKEDIPDLNNGKEDVDSEGFGGIWDDMFDDDADEYNGDGDFEDLDSDFDSSDDFDMFDSSESQSNMMSMFDTGEEDLEDKLNNALDNVNENSVLTRKYLVDTFKSMLPLSSPGFHDKKQIDNDSDQFITIEAICLKALSNLVNCDITEVNSNADRIYETDFSYEIYLKRIKKLSNLTSIEREIEAYFRESSADLAVTAKVDIEGDFYKIIVSKGDTEIVTLGDVLNCQEYYDKFIDEHNRLPLIYGIDEIGNIYMGDGKLCDSTMIAGKQRSGKSWYLLGMLACLMMFNTPEQVQFVIIDPKDTALFKTVSWMPHVAGLHTAKNILEVLDDIINNEGEYRKKLLKNNNADTIWELWDKGIQIPVLYICIDEYISALDYLGERSKELNEKLLVIKTQFPSQGIRVIFIPHRATGVVDKTNRATTSLKVAVRTDLEDTIDTIGEPKWKRPLINPGDMAMRAPGMIKAEFMRGVTLGRSDSENRDIIETAAKAFYKMGVDMPDMSRMPIACNRNAEEIKAELSGESVREQYNANSIYSILEED